MLLLEYEAKNLLKKYDIPVPTGDIDIDNVPTNYPIVVKSQVPVGGRGKLGGIAFAETKSQLKTVSDHIFNTPIKGHLPKVLLYEEKLPVARELYVSLTPHAQNGFIKLMAHRNGGVEIETHTPESFYIEYINKETNLTQAAQKLQHYFDNSIELEVLSDLIKNLIRCMTENDATLLEINPLILADNSQLIAADCKLELDDNAAFRHSEWSFEEQPQDANFVTLNKTGNVATIANGAGLAMATVDAVANAGLIPANFLDIGGGANEASVTKAFKAIVEYKNVRAIIINIFAGITRCDEVAKAVVGAKKHIPNLPPLFIRLDGTNYDEAKIILDEARIELLPALEDCLIKAKEVAR
ncbi:MAG TPA: succinate--CoA ligase subunit beta [Candidatus Saccharimonadales bacterium]